MACVHNMLIRGLNSIYLQAPHVKPQDEKSFLYYSTCFYELLHVHHGGEEADLFPKIEEMSGEKGLMSRNVEQHHAFHQGLEDYNAYIVSCLKGAEKYDGTKLVGIIDGFGTTLVEHLADEITTILDLVKYKDKMGKLEKVFEAFDEKDTVRNNLLLSPARSNLFRRSN
jgi:hemerythrin superfamily protein